MHKEAGSQQSRDKGFVVDNQFNDNAPTRENHWTRTVECHLDKAPQVRKATRLGDAAIGQSTVTFPPVQPCVWQGHLQQATCWPSPAERR